MSIPPTQSTWLQVAKGKPEEVLKFSTDAPVPKAGKGEVLVKISHAALNPVGSKMMPMLPSFMRKLPAVPESDLSGTVVDASDSTRFKNGDLVFGIIPAELGFKTGRGTICQYAVLKDEHLVLKPSVLSFEQAAGISLAGATAHQALTQKGELKAGERVFINGGGSSVGRFAIQIAKALGAYVVVSCSSSSRQACLALGADETVDYTTSPLESQLSNSYSLASSLGFNLIFDTIGSQPLYLSSANYLLPNRKYVVIGVESPKGLVSTGKLLSDFGMNLLRPTWLNGTPREWVFFLTDVKTSYLEDLARWAAEGKFTCSVDSVHEWDQEGVFAAYARLATNKAQGKVVIRIGA
ncbi:hypothetical protein BDY24DRAFT_376997 [Mrakia frigida]|uniref:NAD(P)-dependent alcohol dehydrogenase n=1 Tax=Mrakia frigida TaxID=29902 RepID=UPI003FCC0467